MGGTGLIGIKWYLFFLNCLFFYCSFTQLFILKISKLTEVEKLI